MEDGERKTDSQSNVKEQQKDNLQEEVVVSVIVRDNIRYAAASHITVTIAFAACRSCGRRSLLYIRENIVLRECGNADAIAIWQQPIRLNAVCSSSGWSNRIDPESTKVTLPWE